MEQELRYQDLQQIADAQPELIDELLELQKLAEQMDGDPEEWIAFALTASAIGKAYTQVPKKQDRLWDGC